MGKQIFVVDDQTESSAKRIENLPSVVYYGERSEFKLSSFTYDYEIPGIYILLGDNKIYVGQSSQSVSRRISKHDSEKSWWTDYIIITDEHGNLEKTITEYIEKYFIQYLTQNGVHLENDTLGNFTKVNNLTLLKANQVIKSAEWTIENILNIDLVAYTQGKKSENDDKTDDYVLITEELGEVRSSSDRKLLIQFLKKAAELDYMKLFYLFSDEESEGVLSSVTLSQSRVDDIHIGGDIYLNSKISAAEARELISLCIDELGYTVLR